MLLLARLVQGFSAQAASSARRPAFLVESAATGRRRAFAGSWQQVSVGAGVLHRVRHRLRPHLAHSSEDAMASYGWRIAFVVGGLLGAGRPVAAGGGVGDRELHARVRGDGRTTRSNPLVGHASRSTRVAALRVVGITIAGTLLYYVWVNYMPGYASIRPPMSSCSEALLANFIARRPTSSMLLPFVALLSDRVGRKPTHVRRSRSGSCSSPTRRSSCSTAAFFGTLLLVELIGVDTADRLLGELRGDHVRAVPAGGPRHGHRASVRRSRGPLRRHRAVHHDMAGRERPAST